MSFGGPIDSMIRSHKQNLSLLRKRQKLKDLYDDFDSSQPPKPMTFKEGSFSEIERFKSRLKRERRKNQWRFVYIVFITLIIVMIILYWVVSIDYSPVIDAIN